MEFLSFVIVVSLRAMMLASAAGAAMFACRVKSAAARHAVWTTVIAGTLALAVLPSITPTMPVRVLPPKPAAAVSVLAAPLPQLASAPLPPAERPFPWEAALYGAGLLAGAARLAYGFILTRRLILASRRLPQFEGERVYESTAVSVPLTTGWLRPKILLPADWRAWDAEKLEAVLVHERNHVCRGDWAIAIIAAVNRCVWWFHPLAWWLEARIKSLAEQACDDASLAQVASREAYAEVLVEMAAAVRSRDGRVGWEAMAMAKGAEVRMRVERILDESRRNFPPMTKARWAMLAVCAMPVIYFTAVARPARVLAQQAPPPPVQVTPAPPAATDDAEWKEARARVAEIEAEMAKFKAQNMGRLPEQFQTNVAQLSAYQMQLANANEALTHLQQERLLEQTQLQNLNQQKRYHESQTPEDANRERILSLEQRIVNLQSQLTAAKEMYTENNPTVKRMLAQIATSQLELEIARKSNPPNEKLLLDLEGSIALLSAQIRNTERSLEEKLKQAQEYNRVIAEYQKRIESMPQYEGQYAEMMRRYREAAAYFEQLQNRSTATVGPRLITKIQPLQAGDFQGNVLLTVTVDTEGRVADAQIPRGINATVDAKALEAVKTWRFQPASRNGQPITAFIVVEVPFRR